MEPHASSPSPCLNIREVKEKKVPLFDNLRPGKVRSFTSIQTFHTHTAKRGLFSEEAVRHSRCKVSSKSRCSVRLTRRAQSAKSQRKLTKLFNRNVRRSRGA